MVRKRSNRKILSKRSKRLSRKLNKRLTKTKKYKRLSRKQRRLTKRSKRLSRKNKRKKKNKKEKIKKRGGMNSSGEVLAELEYNPIPCVDKMKCKEVPFLAVDVGVDKRKLATIGKPYDATWGEGPTKKDDLIARKMISPSSETGRTVDLVRESTEIPPAPEQALAQAPASASASEDASSRELTSEQEEFKSAVNRKLEIIFKDVEKSELLNELREYHRMLDPKKGRNEVGRIIYDESKTLDDLYEIPEKLHSDILDWFDGIEIRKKEEEEAQARAQAEEERLQKERIFNEFLKRNRLNTTETMKMLNKQGINSIESFTEENLSKIKIPEKKKKSLIILAKIAKDELDEEKRYRLQDKKPRSGDRKVNFLTCSKPDTNWNDEKDNGCNEDYSYCNIKGICTRDIASDDSEKIASDEKNASERARIIEEYHERIRNEIETCIKDSRFDDAEKLLEEYVSDDLRRRNSSVKHYFQDDNKYKVFDYVKEKHKQIEEQKRKEQEAREAEEQKRKEQEAREAEEQKRKEQKRKKTPDTIRRLKSVIEWQKKNLDELEKIKDKNWEDQDFIYLNNKFLLDIFGTQYPGAPAVIKKFRDYELLEDLNEKVRQFIKFQMD